MSHFDTNYRILENALLDDMISGEYGSELTNAAQALAEAFSAMSVGQITTACHHDYRLSGKLREAARALSALIEEQATDQAQQDREYSRDEAAYERGRELALGI